MCFHGACELCGVLCLYVDLRGVYSKRIVASVIILMGVFSWRKNISYFVQIYFQLLTLLLFSSQLPADLRYRHCFTFVEVGGYWRQLLLLSRNHSQSARAKKGHWIGLAGFCSWIWWFCQQILLDNWAFLLFKNCWFCSNSARAPLPRFIPSHEQLYNFTNEFTF